MKIKSGSISLLNKKKNALPQSKLIKPKKLKPIKKILNNQNIKEDKKQKLCLAINDQELTSNKTKQKKSILKIKNTIKDLDNAEKVKTSSKPKIYKPDSRPTGIQKKNSGTKEQNISKISEVSDASKLDTSDAKAVVNKQLNLNKVTHAVAALLKLAKQDKKELLALPDTIFMEVECIKIPILHSSKQLRFTLPHPLTNELSDVLLITSDKKGAKIYPEKAVDYYTELLEKHGIKFIQQVLPMKTLIREYSQYEMRKKLVAQYDVILAEAKIVKSLPARLGKTILYNRKMPIPVHLDRNNLKEHLQNAISKTQMTVKGKGHKSIVQVGNTSMTDKEVAENILAVTENMSSFPGGWKNIRALDIKTPTSISLPVYFSLASPNSVDVPEEKPNDEEPVVGELSTMMGTEVIVKADGTVDTKIMAEENTLLDEKYDDELLEEAMQFKQSRKSIRHDEDDSEEEAITSTMEEKIMQNYNRSKEEKEGSEEDKEDEGEEEEESDEDVPITPIVGKKRKKEQTKKQKAEQGSNKKQKKVGQEEKQKDKGGKKEVQNIMQMKKDVPKRGSRGGKKSKLSKPQRKGMLKRKNAGKK